MAGEDRTYLAWVRRQVCACGCGRYGCQAHHIGTGAKSMRAHDHEAIPLMPDCHEDRTRYRGKFEITPDAIGHMARGTAMAGSTLWWFLPFRWRTDLHRWEKREAEATRERYFDQRDTGGDGLPPA